MAVSRRTSEPLPPPGGWQYVIALGSNVRHPRHGGPAQVLRAALATLAEQGVVVSRVSPIIASKPLGPSLRQYANGAALVRTPLAPSRLLAALQATERDFGRRRGGRRWCSRVLDLDIVLWEGGRWEATGLSIPHPAFRTRGFVLEPAMTIACRWRDPVTGLSLRHLSARLTRRRRLPR